MLWPSDSALVCPSASSTGFPIQIVQPCVHVHARIPQVRQISKLPGLRHFQRSEAVMEQPPWVEWRKWPSMTLAMDMGGDNMAAFWWLVHKDVAITPIWDWSHGTSNDWKGMLRSAGLMPFWTLTIVAFNSASGPMRDQVRWRQLADAWDTMFEEFSPEQCPWFMEHAGDILNGMGGASYLDGAEVEGTTEQRLWNYLRQRCPVRHIDRINLNRYFSTPRRADEEIPRWHQMLMMNEFCAIEEGMISGGRMSKLIVRAGPNGDDTAGGVSGGGSTAAPTVIDKILRVNGDNSVLIAISILSDKTNLAMARVLRPRSPHRPNREGYRQMGTPPKKNQGYDHSSAYSEHAN